MQKKEILFENVLDHMVVGIYVLIGRDLSWQILAAVEEGVDGFLPHFN